jgi:hypothetical protein
MPVDAKAALFGPAPELPDDTLVDQVNLPQRIGRVLQSQGLKTVGEVRETSDEVLMSFPDLGEGQVFAGDFGIAFRGWRPVCCVEGPAGGAVGPPASQAHTKKPCSPKAGFRFQGGEAHTGRAASVIPLGRI